MGGYCKYLDQKTQKLGYLQGEGKGKEKKGKTERRKVCECPHHDTMS